MSDSYTNMRAELGNREKVAIVGFCTSSRDLAPYNDPTFEIWGLNRGYLFMPRADRWFDMHGLTILTAQLRRPGHHMQWLNAFKGPVYMHKVFPEVTTSVCYPLAEMAEMVGPFVHRVGSWGKAVNGDGSSGGWSWQDKTKVRDTNDEPYLSSSIAYEIALAIYEGFSEIHLYGVDLSTEAEYAWQKPGVEFLLGVAAGKGIKVVLPDNCPLLKGTLYGRGFMSERPEQMSYSQLEQRLESLKNELEQVTAERNRALGAHQERAFLIEQMMPGINHEIAEQRHKQSAQIINTLEGKIHQIGGKIEETAYWISQTMEGQQPKEAMDQLRFMGKHELEVEGPQTDYEEITWRGNTNGHQGAETLVGANVIWAESPTPG